jgi:hypothetical protein
MRALCTFSFLAACIALSTGCISDRAARGLADAVVAQVLVPPAELAVSTMSFQRRNSRWPTNYVELSSFAQSELQTTLAKYDRVDFTERSDGSLEIYAVAPGVTNQMTLRLSETTQK